MIRIIFYSIIVLLKIMGLFKDKIEKNLEVLCPCSGKLDIKIDGIKNITSKDVVGFFDLNPNIIKKKGTWGKNDMPFNFFNF